MLVRQLARGCSWRLLRAPALEVQPLRRRRAASSVTLSEKRLQEFMRAEISYYAGMSARPVKLAAIFEAHTPELAANLVFSSLPVHFATRIKHIESLPTWAEIPELVDVHDTLSESFRNLRLLENKRTDFDLEPLTTCVRDIRQRHKGIVSLLGIAVAHLRAEKVVSEAYANEWLNSFLLARISTEMLTLHYTLLVSGKDGSSGSCRGIVDSRCDPGEICRQAVANIGKDPRYSHIPITVQSYVCKKSGRGIEFSFLPQYLLLLLEELLKNSAWATVRRHEKRVHAVVTSDASRKPPPVPPITVFVGADDRQVMIEISDKGGGIPVDQQDRIWSYSSLSASDRAASHFADDSMGRMGLSWADPLSGLGLKQRLGMGLPLTRLYTEYLGGSLELMSIPGVGVDTFINLRRIDSQSIDSLS